MPAYSSMPGFMCGRVFDVHGSRCSGPLWRVKARSFTQLGLHDGGCKLSFLPPTVEYSSRARRGVNRVWKVRVYHPVMRNFGDWKWLILSLWQLNWEPLLSAFLVVGSLIKHVFPLYASPSIWSVDFSDAELGAMEEHCKWVSLPPNVVVVMKSILATAELCSIEGSAAVCMRLSQPGNHTVCIAVIYRHTHVHTHTHTHIK